MAAKREGGPAGGPAKKRARAGLPAEAGDLAEADAAVEGWRALGHSLLFKDFPAAGGEGGRGRGAWRSWRASTSTRRW